jgi:hypothetical protein
VRDPSLCGRLRPGARLAKFREEALCQDGSGDQSRCRKKIQHLKDMKRREGAPFTEAQLKLIRFAAVEAEYQYLIDELMCAEKSRHVRGISTKTS